MQAFRTRPFTVALGVLVAVAIAWVFFYHECAAGGAMGGWYRDSGLAVGKQASPESRGNLRHHRSAKRQLARAFDESDQGTYIVTVRGTGIRHVSGAFGQRRPGDSG